MPDKLPNHASNPISSSDSCIRVININFQSILSKTAEFLNLIDSLKPHIIFGTEPWLSDTIKDNEIIPASLNYTIYQKERHHGYGGS